MFTKMYHINDEAEEGFVTSTNTYNNITKNNYPSLPIAVAKNSSDAAEAEGPGLQCPEQEHY